MHPSHNLRHNNSDSLQPDGTTEGSTGGSYSTCTDSSFLDSEGASCSDYAANDWCGGSQDYADANGNYAGQCCDYCLGVGSDGSSGGDSTEDSSSPCTDTGFVDGYGAACSDYEHYSYVYQINWCEGSQEWANANGNYAEQCCDYCK